MTKKRNIPVISPILELIELHSEMIEPVIFARKVCSDPDDDKFLEAALSAGASYVVSGDAALIKIKRLHSVEVVTPAQFLRLLRS